jgi:hypothetical protein
MLIEDLLLEKNAFQIAHRMTIGPAFSTIADLVLRHGRSFVRQPLPKGRWQKGVGFCYANALQAATKQRYVYVEGYAIASLGSGTPQLHAWLTDPANPTVAYDPTWGHGVEYFGIPFRLDYLQMMQEASGHPGVLDAWEMKWPLVSGEHPIEDAIWRPEP